MPKYASARFHGIYASAQWLKTAFTTLPSGKEGQN